MDFYSHIELYYKYMIDEDKLTESVRKVLLPFKGGKFLDCACGTGVAMLNLLEEGFDITFSDGSAGMLGILKDKASQRGLIIQSHEILWGNLSASFEQEFDVLLCRGNSIVYAESWDNHAVKEGIKFEVIRESLLNMYDCLKVGGSLIVDIPKEGNTNWSKEYEEKDISGHIVSIKESITSCLESKTRTWKLKITVDGKQFSYAVVTFLIPTKVFTEMLEKCGFDKVEEVLFSGERDHYQIFKCKKS